MEEEDPKKQLTTKVVKQRLKTRIGWRGKTTRSMSKPMNRETPKTATIPMMKLNATMIVVELNKSKDQYMLLELARETELKIAEVDTDIGLYTDGSTSGK